MIRALGVSELDSLADLARQFYGASKWLGTFNMVKFRELWTNLLTSGMGIILVVDGKNGPAGTIGGFLHQDLYSDALVAEEMFWFVGAASRGSGIRLYRAFEVWARQSGAQTIQMVHLADSMPERLADFYLGRGYELVETRYSKRLAT